MLLSRERHCESKVSCLVTPVRAEPQTIPSGEQRPNHEGHRLSNTESEKKLIYKLSPWEELSENNDEKQRRIMYCPEQNFF